jgi:hypothetical protein
MENKNFINLTNGLVYLGEVDNPSFIRIPSTWCEQKRWDDILNSLPPEFYLACASNVEIMVYDAGKRRITRAQWQGIPFIEYVLNRRWFDVILDETFYEERIRSARPYFEHVYKNLHRRTKKLIDYYGKFLTRDSPIFIFLEYKRTDKDGNYDYFVKKFKEEI